MSVNIIPIRRLADWVISFFLTSEKLGEVGLGYDRNCDKLILVNYQQLAVILLQ